MELWEIVKCCIEGSYITGDTFINEFGQELYFDGFSINGIDDASLFSNWEYVER